MVTGSGHDVRSATSGTMEVDPLTVLPGEVLLCITSLLSPRDLLTLACVNRAWRDFFRDPLVWEEKHVRLTFRRIARRHLSRCRKQCDTLFGPGFGPRSPERRKLRPDDVVDDDDTVDEGTVAKNAVVQAVIPEGMAMVVEGKGDATPEGDSAVIDNATPEGVANVMNDATSEGVATPEGVATFTDNATSEGISTVTDDADASKNDDAASEGHANSSTKDNTASDKDLAVLEEDDAAEDEDIEEEDEEDYEDEEDMEEEEDEDYDDDESEDYDEDDCDDCSDGDQGRGDSASCYSTDEEVDEVVRLRLMASAGHLDTLVLDANWMSPAQVEAVKMSHATVRRLTLITSMYVSSMDPPWAAELLRRVAPRVEELSLVPATRSMLAELRNMPRLRRLKIEDYAMRKDEDPNIELVAPSEPGTGIEWLRAYDLPKETTESLLRAYGHSLKEVLLSAGAMEEDEWPVMCRTETLVPMMERCRLRALRRWVRCGLRCFDQFYCEEQRKALQAVLPDTCAVRCGGTSCDRYGDHFSEDFDFIF